VLYERGSWKKHEMIKQRILSNPSVVGIDKSKVLRVTTEFPLRRRKRPIAQPDIVIEYTVGDSVERVFIEIKSGSCKRSLQHLRAQMRKVRQFLRTKNMRGNVMGVYCVGMKLFLVG
jgi:hypothetical protein